MGSIDFLNASYDLRNLRGCIENDISKQTLNRQIVELTKEVVDKYRHEIADIKQHGLKTTLLKDKVVDVIDAKNLNYAGISREDLIKIILDSIFGYSILQKYIEDDTVNDIMVNEFDKIFIRRGMTDTQIPEKFESQEAYIDFLNKVCAFIEGKLNASSPKVDGTDQNYNLRINITSSPINTYSPSLIIRKSHANVDLSRVISTDKYPEEVMKTLELMQKAGCRVVIAGPMESGKTTFMNAYLNNITNERMVIMEDTPEVKVTNPNAVYLQTVESKSEDAVNITLADLVRNFKRSNGTMPIVSEVRGIEAVELLDVFNAGFTRGCTSIHANSPIEVIRQLVFQIKASNKLGGDRTELEEYLSRTIDMIIYMEKRNIVNISEVYFDMDTRKIAIRDLHRYNIERETKDQIIGTYETCMNPFSEKMLDRIRRAGLLNEVPENLKIENY